MILILCHLHDTEAVWLHQCLLQASPAAPVLLVSADELLYARSVRHTLGPEPASFALRLQNGRTVRQEDVAVLINRLYVLDPVLWQHTDQKQYLYVMQEINALYLSLLHSIPAQRLYNPPTAIALGGRYLTPAEWQVLGVRSGLPIALGWPPPAALPVPPETRVLVLDDEILGPLPPGIAPEACREVARQSGMRLLELHFIESAERYVFVGATVQAALHHYGAALVRHFLAIATNGTDLGNTERNARTALAG